MVTKLNVMALGLAGAGVSALSMLVLGIIGNWGMYGGMAQMMMQSHMFFTLSPIGILFGIIEAGIMGFLFGYVIAFIYNRFA
ncbi:MAG: DUF5676 family membrane protein [Candidatus Diapherotrites archaeon]|nr:DUF5676 family membrane protein [Candidatus Diapherotrites archaeon]MDZ4256572.1 DUF5676 family membrane protein [archaeon]